MSTRTQPPVKVKTFTGWTNQAVWMAQHDLTALEFPSAKLPRTPYAYSLGVPVYTDARGVALFCLCEVSHRKFEVWSVSRGDCSEGEITS